MHRAQTIGWLVLLPALCGGGEFSGPRALEATRQIVAIGPRPPGSAGSAKMHAHIVKQVKALGWTVSEDRFTARTPKGPIQMKNIIARKPGLSGKAVAVTGHADTKFFPFRFVGANDAGSSSGLLLELARALQDVRLKNDVYLVWFDGEEAIEEWTATDSLHGSRHLAERWQKDGTNARLLALINVDMIGDRDLKIVQEYYSVDSLRRLVWQVASELGYAGHFLSQPIPIEDDHVPFLKKGVRAVNLIDFEYGPNHAWWHTPEDTMDKLSARSLEITGRVVMETIRRLEPR